MVVACCWLVVVTEKNQQTTNINQQPIKKVS